MPHHRRGETFNWTLPLASREVVRIDEHINDLADGVDGVCRQLFPSKRGYQIQVSALTGVVRGRRYTIRKAGFLGRVSVQLYASRGGYRRLADNSMQVRVGGHARWTAPSVQPKFPVTTLIALGIGLGLALVLMISGGHGLWAIVKYPSWYISVNTFGFLVTAAMVAVSVLLGRGLWHWGQEIPWGRLWPRRIQRVASKQDRARWRALCEHLGSPASVIDHAAADDAYG